MPAAPPSANGSYMAAAAEPRRAAPALPGRRDVTSRTARGGWARLGAGLYAGPPLGPLPPAALGGGRPGCAARGRAARYGGRSAADRPAVSAASFPFISKPLGWGRAEGRREAAAAAAPAPCSGRPRGSRGAGGVPLVCGKTFGCFWAFLCGGDVSSSEMVFAVCTPLCFVVVRWNNVGCSLGCWAAKGTWACLHPGLSSLPD